MNASRLLKVVSIGLVIGIIVVVIEWNTLPLWHSQTINLGKVGTWIDRIQPQVDQFRTAERVNVKLFGFTGLSGAVGIQMTTTTAEQFWKTREFILNLSPPRPIYWTLGLVSADGAEYPMRTLTFHERPGVSQTTTESIQKRLDAAFATPH